MSGRSESTGKLEKIPYKDLDITVKLKLLVKIKAGGSTYMRNIITGFCTSKIAFFDNE